MPAASSQRLAVVLGEPVDELSGDADGGWGGVEIGRFHFGDGVPCGRVNFFQVKNDLAAGVFTGKADHEGVWKRPRLTAKVADIFDLEADFFPNFPRDTFF